MDVENFSAILSGIFCDIPWVMETLKPVVYFVTYHGQLKVNIGQKLTFTPRGLFFDIFNVRWE